MMLRCDGAKDVRVQSACAPQCNVVQITARNKLELTMVTVHYIVQTHHADYKYMTSCTNKYIDLHEYWSRLNLKYILLHDSKRSESYGFHYNLHYTSAAIYMQRSQSTQKHLKNQLWLHNMQQAPFRQDVLLTWTNSLNLPKYFCHSCL